MDGGKVFAQKVDIHAAKVGVDVVESSYHAMKITVTLDIVRWIGHITVVEHVIGLQNAAPVGEFVGWVGVKGIDHMVIVPYAQHRQGGRGVIFDASRHDPTGRVLLAKGADGADYVYFSKKFKECVGRSSLDYKRS